MLSNTILYSYSAGMEHGKMEILNFKLDIGKCYTSINVNTLLVHFVITGAEIIWYEMYYFIMCFTVELNH
jgi:hypothetical protein